MFGCFDENVAPGFDGAFAALHDVAGADGVDILSENLFAAVFRVFTGADRGVKGAFCLKFDEVVRNKELNEFFSGIDGVPDAFNNSFGTDDAFDLDGGKWGGLCFGSTGFSEVFFIRVAQGKLLETVEEMEELEEPGSNPGIEGDETALHIEAPCLPGLEYGCRIADEFGINDVDVDGSVVGLVKDVEWARFAGDGVGGVATLPPNVSEVESKVKSGVKAEENVLVEEETVDAAIFVDTEFAVESFVEDGAKEVGECLFVSALDFLLFPFAAAFDFWTGTTGFDST